MMSADDAQIDARMAERAPAAIAGDDAFVDMNRFDRCRRGDAVRHGTLWGWGNDQDIIRLTPRRNARRGPDGVP